MGQGGVSGVGDDEWSGGGRTASSIGADAESEEMALLSFRPRSARTMLHQIEEELTVVGGDFAGGGCAQAEITLAGAGREKSAKSFSTNLLLFVPLYHSQLQGSLNLAVK